MSVKPPAIAALVSFSHDSGLRMLVRTSIHAGSVAMS